MMEIVETEFTQNSYSGLAPLCWNNFAQVLEREMK